MNEQMTPEEMAALRLELDRSWHDRLESESHTERVIATVQSERLRQREDWGDRHDDGHSAGDWTRFLVRHLGRAEQAIEDRDAATYRRQMVRVAALAVAAVEAHDRALAVPAPPRKPEKNDE